MLPKAVLIFLLAAITQAWIRFRLPGDYSDDDTMGDRERLFRPISGETLIERILRARERLRMIQSLEESSAHADDQDASLIPFPVPMPVRSFGFADAFEMFFMAIVILSMVSAGYIIKNRSEELAASKSLALVQACSKLREPAYGVVDQSVKNTNEQAV
jgi:hypothetical protein